jgi:hypothetical protein
VRLDLDVTHALMGHTEYLDDSYLKLEEEGDIAKAYLEAIPNVSVYELQKGIPERVPTRNGLHMRVPLLIWDDFGAHSNKAKTQHERGWDTFKGAFDTLGTKLGVLLANMVNPTEPTQQTSKQVFP